MTAYSVAASFNLMPSLVACSRLLCTNCSRSSAVRQLLRKRSTSLEVLGLLLPVEILQLTADLDDAPENWGRVRR